MKQSHRMLQLATSLGDDVLLLTGFHGEEFLSRPFRFHLDLISDRNDIPAAEIVGSGVHVRLELPDGIRRSFHGYVNRFMTGDEDGDGRRTYRAEVVPWLWFLTRTSDCRIFQDKTIPEILAQVFADRGFREFDISQVRGAHPKHEYCVQYRETDFQFVSRLMEHEGIFYYFRHEDGKHTLVLGDHGGAYGTCREETVDYPRDIGTRAVRDHIASWEHTYEFRTGRFSHTDYNFKTPSSNLTTAEKTLLKVPGMDRFELYEFPGEYGSKADGAPLAKIRMEAEEAQFDTVRGTSFCRSFSAGNRFTLGMHRHPAEERRSYVLTEVRHEAHEPMAYETGRAPDAPEYRNWFSCIPADVSFRPPRTTVRPVMQGCQTAVVTGPPGEEIFPDEFGRVKVQFHWDREGQHNESSSCWIRVSQLHAGKGWGTMDLPRIGEEVIVTFLEGDPNQPIITGRVYHAENMPPYTLPAGKNLYGIKSNSSKGGGGYNEYVFDESKGCELIREHGQFDKDSTIENDLREHVLRDRSRDVAHDESIQIGNDRTETVGRDESLTIGRDRTESVVANETLSVGGNRSRTVQGLENVLVALNRTHTVGIAEEISIGGMQAVTIGAFQSVDIGATQSIDVGLSQDVSIGTSQSIEVGSDLTESVGGSRSASIAENESLTVGKVINVEAGEQIVIKTGKASLVLRKDGTIQVNGKDIAVTGTGKIALKATKDVVIKGKKILQN